MKIVGITGGIGAGKSVVSKILTVTGYQVYDSDSRAKSIMDESKDIKSDLCRLLHPDAVDISGAIDRKLISELVFNDDEKLAILNRIVHSAVRQDFKLWCEAGHHSDIVFVECAILHTSGLSEFCDYVWEVKAPESTRIQRIVRRNNCTPRQAAARIKAQFAESMLNRPGHYEIINDGVEPVLPQTEALLSIVLK